MNAPSFAICFETGAVFLWLQLRMRFPRAIFAFLQNGIFWIARLSSARIDQIHIGQFFHARGAVAAGKSLSRNLNRAWFIAL